MPWGRADSFYLLNTKELLYVRDEKAANTAGGGFTSGSFQTRTLNTTVTNTISGASLASNQVTLPAGTYFVHGRAPAAVANRHKAILYNVTDAANQLIGSNAFGTSTSGSEGMTDSFVFGVVTITAQKVFELRHQCQTTKATDGFGITSNFGVVEVYAELMAWKVN